MKTIRTLIFVVLAMVANTAFGQDFVGKMPTQERKIKLRQMEERSGRVPQTAAVWQQYAKANSKAEQRAAADKALTMLYGDAAFYSYINNEGNEVATARLVGYIAEVLGTTTAELKELQSKLLAHIESTPASQDADAQVGNILYNKRVLLERDNIPLLLKGRNVEQLLQQSLTENQWRKFNSINRLNFHNMTSALLVLESYYGSIHSKEGELVQAFGQSKVMSSIKQMIAAGELTLP
ncbi:MAG: hypothetical protein II262_01115 [Alistipes sp.]|nr:hypothetical protein [Alistipes sp.]